LLKYLIEFFAEIASGSDESLMGPKGLSKLFGGIATRLPPEEMTVAIDRVKYLLRFF
jgi:hypothetical protein